ncbi:MAG: carboxypeptidase regulatory-like domain-containing protein [bacterium]
MNSRYLTIGILVICLVIIIVIVFMPGRNEKKVQHLESNQSQITAMQPTVAGSPTPPSIPTEYPRPPQTTEAGGETIAEMFPVDDSSSAPLHRVITPSPKAIPNATPFTPQEGKLVGRVIDQYNRPVASAKITIQALQGIWIKETEADFAGRFVEKNPPDNPVRITASMNGYLDEGQGTRTIQPNQNEEILLVLILRAYTLSGRVTHRDTQSPIAGFFLLLTPESQTEELSRTASTDGSGWYTFSEVKPGRYVMTEDAEKNPNISLPVKQNARKVLVGERDVRDIDFTVVPSEQIIGMVQTQEQIPVANAEVTMQYQGSKKVQTDEQGKFQYSAPSGGILIASHPDYGFGISPPVQSANGNNQSRVVIITLQGPGSIFGRVSEENRTPLEGVDVELLDAARGIRYQTETNMQGFYSIEDVPLLTLGESQATQSHTIQFSKDGYATKTDDVLLYPGEITTHNVQLNPSSTIAGMVMDTLGNRLPGVKIKSCDRGGNTCETQSDQHGIYTLKAMPGQEYCIQFIYHTSPQISKWLFNIPAGSSGVNVTLDDRDWVVEGRVLSAETNQPVAPFSIILEGSVNNTEFVQNAKFNSVDGQYQLEIGEAGTYRICCIARGYAPMERLLQIDDTSDPSIEVFFTVHPSLGKGRISGELVPPEGTQLYEIELVGLERTPTHGNQFFLYNLPEGSYAVILYVREDNDRFSRPIGSIPDIEVKRDQETSLGKIQMGDLISIIHEF